MELQSPVVNSVRAKRQWKLLKIVFRVIRRGLISKAKLLMDLNRNLMSKRGQRKFVRDYTSPGSRAGSFGVSEYEFSCTNSPNPIFFRTPKKKQKQVFFFFSPSCLRFPDEFGIYDPKSGAVVPGTPEYLFNYHLDASFNQSYYDQRNGPPLSPFAVRVSDYLSMEEDGESDGRVDHAAEEFIKRFYEQLRVQSPLNLR